MPRMILAIHAALRDAAGILDAADLALVFRGPEIRLVVLVGIFEQRHGQNDQSGQAEQDIFQPAHFLQPPPPQPGAYHMAADRLSARPASGVRPDLRGNAADSGESRPRRFALRRSLGYGKSAMKNPIVIAALAAAVSGCALFRPTPPPTPLEASWNRYQTCIHQTRVVNLFAWWFGGKWIRLFLHDGTAFSRHQVRVVVRNR